MQDGTGMLLHSSPTLFSKAAAIMHNLGAAHITLNNDEVPPCAVCLAVRGAVLELTKPVSIPLASLLLCLLSPFLFPLVFVSRAWKRLSASFRRRVGCAGGHTGRVPM